VSIIKDQIPISDLSRISNSKYNKGPDTSQRYEQKPNSKYNKAQIPVSDLSRSSNSEYNKGPDTSQ
jgi:hypothetical protein